MKPFSLEELTITVHAHPEDWEELDDHHFDAEFAEEIRQAMRRDPDNAWLWCCVEVAAEWRGLAGNAYLGCCTYESEQEFLLDDYYPDLVDEAVAALSDIVAAFQRPDTL